MNTFHTLGLPFVLALCWPVVALPAQQEDPVQAIKEIARNVDEQLQEIDRLLLESSKKSQPRSEPKSMLKQAHEHSETVEDGINRLIEKLTEMKNKGGGGSSQEPQDQPPKDGQGQKSGQQQKQGNQNRRENQTPNFVQQGKEGEPKDGEQPQPDKQGQSQPQKPTPDGSPDGGQQTPDRGENTVGNRQPEPETGPGQRGDGEQSWGELQSYVNFLKNRGSPPKVPEKYRKYWEAYLKQKRDGGGK